MSDNGGNDNRFGKFLSTAFGILIVLAILSIF